MKKTIAILGAGSLGLSIASGLLKSSLVYKKIIITRKSGAFSKKENKNFECLNNVDAVKHADVLILCVKPNQIEHLAMEIKEYLDSKHLVISPITAVSLQKLKEFFSEKADIVRVMPNMSIRTLTSMTFIAENNLKRDTRKEVMKIFSVLGKVMLIPEEKFGQATVLSGSGVAIMARFVRVYQQAGIHAGFSEHDALTIAIQVMKGTVALLESKEMHPEVVIDSVTTPAGCTIEALVCLEHYGFASALLKAIFAGTERVKAM